MGTGISFELYSSWRPTTGLRSRVRQVISYWLSTIANLCRLQIKILTLNDSLSCRTEVLLTILFSNRWKARSLLGSGCCISSMIARYMRVDLVFRCLKRSRHKLLHLRLWLLPLEERNLRGCLSLSDCLSLLACTSGNSRNAWRQDYWIGRCAVTVWHSLSLSSSLLLNFIIKILIWASVR